MNSEFTVSQDARTVGVTGANGYVGSQLRDHFSRQGWTVYSLVREQRLSLIHI